MTIDLENLEGVLRLMKQYGVPALRAGELHVHMPHAILSGAPHSTHEPPATPTIEVNEETGEATITVDPDLFGAVGGVR